jgi:hypothetical protein
MPDPDDWIRDDDYAPGPTLPPERKLPEIPVITVVEAPDVIDDLLPDGILDDRDVIRFPSDADFDANAPTYAEWDDMTQEEAVAIFFPGLVAGGVVLTETVVTFLYLASAVAVGYVSAEALNAWLSENQEELQDAWDELVDQLSELEGRARRSHCAAMNNLKHAICDPAGGRSCTSRSFQNYLNTNPSHAELCTTLLGRAGRSAMCAAVRQAHSALCFPGAIDAGHASAAAQAAQAAAACTGLALANGCQGAP